MQYFLIIFLFETYYIYLIKLFYIVFQYLTAHYIALPVSVVLSILPVSVLLPSSVSDGTYRICANAYD